MTPALKPLKWYKSLSTRKGRLEAEAFLIEGERAISQVMIAAPEQITEILAVEPLPAQLDKYPLRLLDEKQFKDISSATTPQGIMAVVSSPKDMYSAELPANPGSRILLLEDIQDPGNTGTLIRTAAAFGYDGIIMTDNCADPLSPKVVQSTAGSILSLWIRRTREYLALLDNLKGQGYSLAAAVLDGTDTPDEMNNEQKLILALGNEASGLSPKITARATTRIRVPVNTKKAESLNVASCGAVCMYLSIYSH